MKQIDSKIAALLAELANETAPHANKVRSKLEAIRRIIAEAEELVRPSIAPATDSVTSKATK